MVGVTARFSDAELAAEVQNARCDAMIAEISGGHFWAPFNETWATDLESAHGRFQVLMRFAEMPHAAGGAP